MEQKSSKKRKCGPRVKTGCITCRIRRVKCDEEKPSCQRCTSTGRKCDGYSQLPQKTSDKSMQLVTQQTNGGSAQSLTVIAAMEFLPLGSPRERQLFHFYCVQSAFDLSIYLNSSFWYNKILQYSQHHPVVRQAVIAFGASHSYAISINAAISPRDMVAERYEQAQQYDKAIRWLRQYMETTEQPDPHVILICCALFFSSENGRGNREAALQHLEKGLHIINSERRRKINGPTSPTGTGPSSSSVSQEPCPEVCLADSSVSEIDEELLYVFSRLDCQATLCHENRVPVLDLDDLAEPSTAMYFQPFVSITDAQRGLDLLHNRLARFLTNAGPHMQDSADNLPSWVVEQKRMLHMSCVSWEDTMNDLISMQSPSVRHILQHERPMGPRNEPDWQVALQIQLLVLHHRCWWMLFRSSYPYNATVFTMSPNPRAEEILNICEFLGFSLPVRPSSTVDMTDADMAWKLISEIGVAAPLSVLATKCTDDSIRSRAMRQLEALREHRNGVYDKMFLSKVMNNIRQQTADGEVSETGFSTNGLSNDIQEFYGFDLPESSHRSPLSVSDSEASCFSRSTTVESGTHDEPRELLGWGRKASIPELMATIDARNDS